MNELLNYKTFLKDRLNEKVQANPKYSLRAFARDLEVSPSVLSELLNGKHGLSEKVAKRIAQNLDLSTHEIQIFCDQVVALNSKSLHKKNQAKERIDALKEMHQKNSLQLDHFKIISDWYHFAILELTYLEGFKSDTTWIAKKLGITKLEVESAIERLLRIELLEIKNKKYVATEDFTASPDGIPSDAIKKYQRQLIEKALQAQVMQSVENRDITSLLVAINKNDLLEAKKEIKEFRRRFNSKFGTSKKKDSVYCLALQFFELTEKTI